jgi:hypothetical protein
MFHWHQKTASGVLLLFALLFDVGGANSFRLSSHKTRHQERRHACFPAVIVSAGISTVVAEWRFPWSPRTPYRGAWNEAAGRFATKTPAFTTQDGNAKSRTNICLFTFVHLLLIDEVNAITTAGPNNPLPNGHLPSLERESSPYSQTTSAQRRNGGRQKQKWEKCETERWGTKRNVF